MEYPYPSYVTGNVFPSMQGRVPQFPVDGLGLTNPYDYTYRGLGNQPAFSPAANNQPGIGSRSWMGQGQMPAPTNIGGQPATQQASPYTLGVPPSSPGTAISNAPPAQMPSVSQSSPASSGPSGYGSNYARGGLVDAADKLKSAGRYGDSELVHVNPIEREAMRHMFGPETRNPHTGLPEHFLQFLPMLLAAGKALLASKVGSTLASTAISALASKALGGGGSSGSSQPSGPAVPGVLTPKSTLQYNTNPREQTTYDINPFTYGQKGGEKTFFKPYNPMDYSIKTPVAPAPIQQDYSTPEYKEGGKAEEYDKDDLTDHLVAYSRGGGHEGPGPVRGIGSGQEDKIPAWLSDGEYVWSAQDVADLGDGSTNEGVRRLDKMRHMVRAQAGRKNVKSIAKPQKGIDQMLKAVGGQV